MTTVKCHVNTCTHWLKGMCGAGNIDILSESTSFQPVEGKETQCKTFHKREGIGDYLSSLDNVNWTGTAASLLGGEMSPSITCTVDTCHYWGQGDRCQAEAIEISGSNADESRETNCQTYSREGAQ
ncbi:MAG: DUF1540 domain-containing protein [Bacillota bacterium]|jgi:hypothetical protein